MANASESEKPVKKSKWEKFMDGAVKYGVLALGVMTLGLMIA